MRGFSKLDEFRCLSPARMKVGDFSMHSDTKYKCNFAVIGVVHSGIKMNERYLSEFRWDENCCNSLHKYKDSIHKYKVVPSSMKVFTTNLNGTLTPTVSQLSKGRAGLNTVGTGYTRAKFDLDLCYHMGSLGHNELTHLSLDEAITSTVCSSWKHPHCSVSIVYQSYCLLYNIVNPILYTKVSLIFLNTVSLIPLTTVSLILLTTEPRPYYHSEPHPTYQSEPHPHYSEPPLTSEPHPPYYSEPHTTDHSEPHPPHYSEPHPNDHSEPHPPHYSKPHPIYHSEPHPPHYSEPHPPHYSKPHPIYHSEPHPPHYSEPHPTYHSKPNHPPHIEPHSTYHSEPHPHPADNHCDHHRPGSSSGTHIFDFHGTSSQTGFPRMH